MNQALIPALVTIFLWSSAFAGIRAGLTGFSPLHLTLLRFAVASLVFAVYALFAHIPLPRRRDIPSLFLLSLFGITFYHTALNIGEQTVSAGAASLIIAIAPVFTAILSHFVLKEQISPWGWLGLLVSIGGISIMVLGGGNIEFTRGSFYILFSSLCTAIFFVYEKPLLLRYRPIHLTAYFTWLGTLPLLVIAPGFSTALSHAPLSATLAGVYIGIFPAAVAYAAWSMALAKMPAGQATSLLYLTPPLAMLFGVIWVHEVPQLAEVVGGLVALAGVIMVNSLGRNSRRPSLDQQRTIA